MMILFSSKSRYLNICLFLFLTALLSGTASMASEYIEFEMTLHAPDFGVTGDGITDDGPALQEALNVLVNYNGSARLLFEANSTCYIESVPETYIIDWVEVHDQVIDGNNTTFLLAGDVRFMQLEKCRNIETRNLNIDYTPLPFADGIVVAKNPEELWVDVQVFDEFDLPPLGGPTRTGGEQAYFGMIWNPGPYDLVSRHYWLADTLEAYPGSLNDRVIRLVAENFDAFQTIEIGKTVVSLPVRGIAHRGGAEVFRIRSNENVYFENIDVWSAPWFVFGIHSNRGEVINRNVNIRPKPGTQRHTSAWRDGFHVKGNYADLLWEDCHFEGMNDDAFNISTHMSYVQQITSPTQIEVIQNFPLGIVPLAQGDTLVAYDVPGGKILGRREITAVEGTFETDWSSGSPRSPWITVHFDEAIPGLKENDLIWNESSANPNTILRRCTIKMSCRLQSSITIDDCDVTALLWFYGENIEGPIPSSVEVLNSRLRLGRGNPNLAVSFTSAIHGRGPSTLRPQEPVITNILLRNNEIDGHLNIDYAENVSLQNNRFLEPRSRLRFLESKNILLQNNTIGTTLISSLEQIEISPENATDGIVFQNSIPEESLNLMKPFPRWYTQSEEGKLIRFHRLPDALRPQRVGLIAVADAQLDAYTIPLAASTARYNGMMLNEMIPSEFAGLSFTIYLPENSSNPVQLSVLQKTDTENNTLYQALLDPETVTEHHISLPESVTDDLVNIVIVLTPTNSDNAIVQTVYVGNVRATRTRPDTQYHSADINKNRVIELGEFLRVGQLYHTKDYHCDATTPDGYAPGMGPQFGCTPHSSDFAPQNWQISLNELLRLVQIYNSDGYSACSTLNEDGFCMNS